MSNVAGGKVWSLNGYRPTVVSFGYWWLVGPGAESGTSLPSDGIY